MQYKELASTNWKVSTICLGTMTFGEQNSQEEAFEQIDYALDHGVNFMDTAEMYSVPGRAETYGSTERIIGNWIEARGGRDRFYLATKATGPSRNMHWISDNLGFSKARLTEALEKSLRNLKTDYIDLYQLHWPERNTNCFSVRGYKHRADEHWDDNFNEALDTLDSFIQAGKIRAWGLSNETPYGVLRTEMEAAEHGYHSAASIQNPYSLLNRTFEIGLAEMAIKTKMPLLAYSPLGFGRLTNKFHNGTDTPAHRINKFPQMARYNKPPALKAAKAYYELAQANGMSLATMALAFINQQAFVGSNIIGATNLEQLKENIASADVLLSNDILKEIEKIHESIPNPAP